MMNYLQTFVTAHTRVHLAAAGLAIICLLFTGKVGLAAQQQTLFEQIHVAIEAYSKETLRVNAVKMAGLDPRLKMQPCASRLEVFLPSGARSVGQSTLGVRCQADKGWKVFVPVQLVRYAKVLVTKRPLPRGSVIGPGDVYLEKRDLSRLHQGHYTDPQQIIGMQVKRPLRQHTVLSPSQLKARRLVKRGENITILAEMKGLTVRVTGHALMDGYRGDAIKVKNGRSDRLLQAEVIGPGLVRVRM